MWFFVGNLYPIVEFSLGLCYYCPMEREHPDQAPQENQRPEVLNKHYKYLVVDPYSVNVKTPELDINGNRPPQFGEARLSFYSAFVINTAYNMWLQGKIDNIILFGDASFGDARPSTADLMKEFLMRQRKDGRKSVPEANIIVFDDPDLNQTATQLKKLSQEGIGKTEPVLYLSWGYHGTRVDIHASGYKVKIDRVIAEDKWKELNPEFDLEKLKNVLPRNQIYLKEFPRMLEAALDPKGLLPIKLKGAGDGAVVDIEKVGPRVEGKPRKLKHVIVPGKKRLKELGLK